MLINKNYFYFFFTVSSLLIACNKDDNNANTQSDVYIQYKANGQSVKITGNLIPDNPSTDVGILARRSERGLFVNNFYEISARNKEIESIDLNIPVDSLEEKNYNLDYDTYSRSAQAGVDLFHNDSSFRLQRNSDFTNITITSYKDGLISGTFTGVMSNYDLTSNSYTPIKITDGSFNKVKVNY